MRSKHLRRANKERRAALRASRGGTLLRFVRQRPVLVVGAGFALGMAFGALLPWRIVDEDLIEDGWDAASEGYEKAKSAVQDGLDAATGVFNSASDTSDNDRSSGRASK